MVGGFIGFQAQGDTFTWNQAAGGDYNTPANWTPDGPPGSVDLGIIDNNVNGDITLSASTNPQLLSFRNTSGAINFDLNGQTLTLGSASANGSLQFSNAAGQVNDVTFTDGTISHLTTSGIAFVLGSNGSNGNQLTLTGPTIFSSPSTSTHTVGPAGSNDNRLRVLNGASLDIRGSVTLGQLGTSSGNRFEVIDATFRSIGGNRGVTMNQGTLTVTNSLFDTGFLLGNAVGNAAVVEFNSGTITARRILIDNGSVFTVGDGGVIPAYLGGSYSNPTLNFANGLVLNSNGRLVGTGTVSANITGNAGAQIDPRIYGQTIITTDDREWATLSITGDLNNTNIAMNFDTANFASQEINDITPPLDPATDIVNVSGQFTFGGTLEIDLASYVAPIYNSFNTKVVGWGSTAGTSTDLAVSFINGDPLSYQIQSDGVYVNFAVSALNAHWNFTGTGSWTDSGNWLGPVPNAINSIANFGTFTGASTITLDSAATVGVINFIGANPFVVEGTGSITFDVNGIQATGITMYTQANPVAHAINVPIVTNDNLPVGVSTSATLTLASVAASAGQSMTKNGGGHLYIGKIDVGTLNINAGTTQLAANGTAAGVAEATDFTIGAAAKLDITDNGLVVNYTGTSPMPAIKAAILTGFNAGLWDGVGINSSIAAGSADLAIGYAENSDLGASDVFGSIGVDSTTVVVRTTYKGDSTLDGKVNTLDFNHLAGGFGSASPDWVDGDYNFDGMVDSTDYNAFISNYGKALPGAAPALGAVVPEPALLGLMAFAPLALRRRRLE